MEQQRPRRRCSLARVLIGVVVFALVAFVATHGWLQSLQDVEREVEHLFHPHQMGRDHFVRTPTDGADTLCDEGGCRSLPVAEPSVEVQRDATDDVSRPGTRQNVAERVYYRRRPGDGSGTSAAEAERRAADEGERTRVKAAEAAAAREAPRETRHHYVVEDDGALRARRAREVHLGIRDAGPHALATGYTGSDFPEEDHDPNAPEDLQKHFEETAVLWDRVRRELDKLPIPLVEEPTGKELYHQGYDPWDFKCYDLSCLEGRNLTYTPPPGVVVRAGGKREFDNEGPSVQESLRMLGGKPATELREFPEVVAKRKRGEKPYMDDDDEAGGASTQAAVDVGIKPQAAPGHDDDDGEDKSAVAAADVVFAGGSWAPTAQTERTTPAPTARPKATPTTPIACKSAVYWRAPSHARSTLRRRHRSETHEKRYVTFEPDHGGWNNIRMGMETAALFAWSTGRILVLPAKARLYLVSKAAKAHGPFDFYDLDLITEGGGVTTTEEYLKERTGTSEVQGCKDEHLASCKALHFKLRELAHTVLWKPRTDFLVLGTRFGAPDDTTTRSIKKHAAGRKLVDVDRHPSHNATTIHFATDAKRDLRFLTHFYTFMRWARADLGRAARRVARDELRYRREIQCAAAEVIDLLNEKAKGKNWTAIHVRRGDFQFTEAKVDANAVLKAVDSVAQDSLVYVATDERKRDFFAPLAQKYTLVFLDDLATKGSKLQAALLEDPNWAGMVEQLICGAAPVFLGTWWSTFTGYITRIRGYRGLRSTTFYVLPKYRNAFIKSSKPVGGAAWWREWPTGFEDIDDDHRLFAFAREMSGHVHQDWHDAE
jgi:hypothetical protein